MNNIFGEFSISNVTIYNWTAEFKCGRASINDERRLDNLKNDENIQK